VRALLWIIGLFALAVALPVAARYFPGYVLLVLPSHRVELSLSFAVILLVAGFVLTYILLRAWGLTVGMPARAQAFRREQRRLQAQRSFQQALIAFFEGRYGRAERAARESLEAGEAPGLCLAIAARSAHEQKHFQLRDDYLQQMETRAPQSTYLRLMTQAELLLEDRRYHDALQALSRLQDKHTAALRLELRAQQQAKNWDQVLSLLPQLDKRKVLEPSLLEQIRRYAQTENLKRKAIDAKSLHEYWDRLPLDERRASRVAAAAAQSFIALGDCAQAHAIIEQSLDAEWDPALLLPYVECLPRDARRHLERAEAWLKQHPGDPALLLALGELCIQQELWGKARSYLEASLAIEPGHSAYVQLGRLLERIGKPEEASRAYRKGLELSLAQLKLSTGGRRRVPL
jgi:HemY protein